MTEETYKNTFQNKIKIFLYKNFKNLIIFSLFLILILFSYFFYKNLQKKKEVQLSSNLMEKKKMKLNSY